MTRACNCGPDVTLGSYANAVAVPIPPHMESYRVNRIAAGLSGFVCIDRCILREIQELWAEGIRTYGSCCGHNTGPSMVNVHADDDEAMLGMGYVRWPHVPEGGCPNTFYLKSVATPEQIEATA